MACRSVWSRIGLVLLLGLVGCADANFGEVSGSIKVDGNLVEAGAIRFSPVEGDASPAGAEITKNGQYKSRVPVGLMKVSISVPKVVAKKKLYDTPDSPEMPVTVESLSSRYNTETELRLEVKPGKNEKDFDLPTK